MRKLGICILLISCLPTYAGAAQVFGSLKYGDRAVGQGVLVNVQCGDRAYPTKTNEYGSYGIYVRERKCTLAVYYENRWSRGYDIYPDDSDPVRYDFEMGWENGTLVLWRK